MIVAILAAALPQELEGRLAALPWNDVVAELRLDLTPGFDLSQLQGFDRPWIATCRRIADGGAFAGDEDARAEILKAALAAGARWIDVEADRLESASFVPPEKCLASFHDLEATPSSIEAFVSQAVERGADRIKVATKTRELSDLLRLSRLSRIAPGRVVAFGLGAGAVISRVLRHAMGSPWVYVWADDPARMPDGVGLLSAAEADELYGPALLRGEAEPVFGVLGQTAEASIGPLVFNRIFRAASLPPVYVPLSAQSVVGLREAMRHFHIRGLSVTQPFKEAVLPIADRLHPLVERIGAANTLLSEDGGLVAYNTDYRGVLETVRAALGEETPGGAALVVGAGGAARAAAVALDHLGFAVQLWARREEAAKAVAQSLRVQAGPWPTEAPRVIVNATPLGGLVAKEAMAVPESLLGGREQIVLDAVYAPTETPLLRAARARGARIVSGDEFYAVQARHQLHLFWAGLGDIDAAVHEATQWALKRRGYR